MAKLLFLGCSGHRKTLPETNYFPALRHQLGHRDPRRRDSPAGPLLQPGARPGEEEAARNPGPGLHPEQDPVRPSPKLYGRLPTVIRHLYGSS